MVLRRCRQDSQTLRVGYECFAIHRAGLDSPIEVHRQRGLADACEMCSMPLPLLNPN